MNYVYRAALVAAAVLGFGGCGNGERGSASASASPSTSNKPAASASASSKLVHIKQAKGACTFELDAPEALKETAQDGMSVTLKGESFSFQGYAGSSLYGLDQLAGLATMGAKDSLVSKETANGVNLVITRNAEVSNPMLEVSGQGEEASYEGRVSPIGCSFLCNGPKAREAEVLALCRSVRISYDARKAE